MTLTPSTPEELAAALAGSAGGRKTIRLQGANSKSRYGGPTPPPEVTICTTLLNRVLEYEPNDLTVSVEAGLRWADFQKLLAANRQMVPLDPPYYHDSTVGGVVAANTGGPRRRLYGSVRDAVIGMKFATLEGNIVSSGGMVVKNVAGLDMGKLMIGSFGTLAAIAVVNFKLSPIPPVSRTFLYQCPTLKAAIEIRDRVLTGVLQPAAIDIVRTESRGDYLMAVQAGGSEALLSRYEREMEGAEFLDGEAERVFWESVREFVPAFLEKNPEGCVVRASDPLHQAPSVTVPFVYRAGNGITQACYADPAAARRWMMSAGHAVVETHPYAHDQWPAPGSDFEVMKKIKRMFDPHQLLNPGRLHGRI